MKQMEYTIKVVTDAPMDIDDLHEEVAHIDGVASAEITNFRVLPKPKAAKS